MVLQSKYLIGVAVLVGVAFLVVAAPQRGSQKPLPEIDRIEYWHNNTSYRIDQDSCLYRKLATEARKAINQFDVRGRGQTLGNCRQKLSDSHALYIEFSQSLTTTRNGYPLTSAAYLLHLAPKRKSTVSDHTAAATSTPATTTYNPSNSY